MHPQTFLLFSGEFDINIFWSLINPVLSIIEIGFTNLLQRHEVDAVDVHLI